VQHTRSMRGIDSARQLEHRFDAFARAAPFAQRPLHELLAAHELHGKERHAFAVHAGSMQPGDTRMRKPRQGLCFSSPEPHSIATAATLPQHLERDRHPTGNLDRLVDRAHTALAEFVDDAIAGDEVLLLERILTLPGLVLAPLLAPLLAPPRRSGLLLQPALDLFDLAAEYARDLLHAELIHHCERQPLELLRGAQFARGTRPCFEPGIHGLERILSEPRIGCGPLPRSRQEHSEPRLQRPGDGLCKLGPGLPKSS
jgi:hypothetical protein